MSKKRESIQIVDAGILVIAVGQSAHEVAELMGNLTCMDDDKISEVIRNIEQGAQFPLVKCDHCIPAYAPLDEEELLALFEELCPDAKAILIDEDTMVKGIKDMFNDMISGVMGRGVAIKGNIDNKSVAFSSICQAGDIEAKADVQLDLKDKTILVNSKYIPKIKLDGEHIEEIKADVYAMVGALEEVARILQRD